MLNRRAALAIGVGTVLQRPIGLVPFLLPTRTRADGGLSVAAVVGVIAIVQGVVGLISAFTAKGDGGLGAMLQAQYKLQLATIKLLGQVSEQIANVQLQLNQLREDLPLLLEQDRLKGYFDDVSSSASHFRSLIVGLDGASGAAKKKIEAEFLLVEERIVAVRGRLENYASFDAALPLALCMSVEVASRFRTGKGALVPETLRSYLAWCDRILNDKSFGSLGRSLPTELNALNQYAAINGLSDGALYQVNCVTPEVVVWDQGLQLQGEPNFAWPYPTPKRAMFAKLVDKDDPTSGAKQMSTGGATYGHAVKLDPCPQSDLWIRANWSNPKAVDDEVEDKMHKHLLLTYEKTADGDLRTALDTVNRLRLRLALIASLMQAVRESRQHAQIALERLGA